MNPRHKCWLITQRKRRCLVGHLTRWLVATALANAALAPSCSKPPDPQQSFDHALSTLHHGDIARAGEEANEGYDKFHRLGGGWAWKFAVLRARVLYWGGDNDKALQLLNAEPAPPCCGDLGVQRLRLEGVIHSAQHKFGDAERELLDAQRLCSEEEYPSCGDLNSTLGRLEMDKGRYLPAQDLFRRALASARTRGDRFMEADALLNLSWSSDEQAHFDEALSWAGNALAISQADGFEDTTETAWGNMGWAYYKLGDPEKAEAMFAEAERQAEKLGDVSDQARWFQTQGYVYLDAGKFDAAEASFRNSLAKADKIHSREHMTNSLIALAFVSEQTGKIDDATRYASEALSMARADGNKRDETYPRLVQGRIAARSHDFNSAEAAFNEVAASSDSPVFLKWEAERSLARLYEDENQIAKADSEYRTALTTFERARSELQHENSRLPFLNNATRIYDDYIHLLISQGKVEQALQVANYSRARTLSEGLGLLKKASTFQPDLVNAREIARRAGFPSSRTKREKDGSTNVEGGTAIFFYWLGEKQSYLWAVTPLKIQLFSLPPASEIDATVQRYRRALLGPEDPVEVSSSDGLQLYRTLVEPAASLLGKNPRVFIIPDGSLNTLNFETLLVDGAKPHYWIEDVTLADASSLRLLGRPQGLKPQFLSELGGTGGNRALPGSVGSANERKSPLLAAAARSRAPLELVSLNQPTATTGLASLAGGGMPPPLHNQLLLIGNAVAANADYPELRKAAAEMESIAKHFGSGDQRTFTRDLATPAAYLGSSPGQFSYIHFVAHGTASRMNPLDSAIVLSATGAQEDSFKLYARDIIQHPLRAQLVTISTCYGAGARAYSGEGLVGLSWAFLRAGAHNVIGALWEVSDVSTPQLMDDLYGELQKGRSPDAALRAAKLALLHSGTSFRRPFYWAPFQLYTGS